MAKTVAELQLAFQTVVNKIKRNKEVVALFTFGSILSGDVWEGSDIDLFLVYKEGYFQVRDLFSNIQGVPVHTKILGKESFMSLYNNEGKKEYILNLLTNSKLVFTRDEEITSLYNNSRYLIDKNNKKRNLVYLGMLLSNIGITKKYLHTGGLITSYEVLIRTLDSYGKLYLNFNGYTVTKDVISMTSNLDNNFKVNVDKLISGGLVEKNIKETLAFIEGFVEENIQLLTDSLIQYLKDEDKYLSSYEISNSVEFQDFKINMENILQELERVGITYRKNRVFQDNDKNSILVENVYCYRK